MHHRQRGVCRKFSPGERQIAVNFSQECRHPWRETVEGMGNGQKDDTYKSLVMRFNIFTLQIQISLSTEYICTFFLSITFIEKHFDVK